MRIFSLISALLLIGLCWQPVPCAGAPNAPPVELPDFTRFSLEELKDVEIISASRRPGRLSQTPAAVYVITREDIRRSGATSIPDALRMATGVQVARITATDWAVNIRGLNNRFANNLLVLIDGRSVYSHVFSGVFWDIQDTVLEDIERIEVIRGPGAAIWGSNAVNGVINIITRNAAETQGGQAIVLGGNQEQVASLRYGDTLKDMGFYRVYGKFFNRGELDTVVSSFKNETLNSQLDAQQSSEWRSGRLGFRTDLAPGRGLPAAGDNQFTLQGETYSNRYDTRTERQSIIFPFNTIEGSDTSEASGGFLMGNWQHTFSNKSHSAVQAYIEHAAKDYDPGSGEVTTADLDFQHRFVLEDNQDVIWGFEFRRISDEFDNDQDIKLDPANRDFNLLSAFIQDEVTVIPERLKFTLGSKFEHNDFTGWEVQPSLRMLYNIQDSHVIWGALSRAVRVPSRLELDGRTDQVELLPGMAEPAEVTTLGNNDLESEVLTALELGYRIIPFESVWINSTVFYNNYDNLIELVPSAGSQPDGPIVLQYQNSAQGNSWGFEMTADWQATIDWHLSAGYTYLRTDIDQVDSGQPELDKLLLQGSNPRHTVSLRSMLNLTPRIDTDLWLRYVDTLPERDVDSYITLDARLAYRLSSKIELALVGQNLFEEGHEEFSSLQVERSVYGKIDWRF